MADDDVLDVVRLQADLGELDVDGDVGGADGVHPLDGGAPVARVGDDPVIVARVEQDIAFRVPDDEERHRDLDRSILGPALKEALGHGESSGAEDAQLHAGRGLRVRRRRGEGPCQQQRDDGGRDPARSISTHRSPSSVTPGVKVTPMFRQIIGVTGGQST